MNPFKLSITNNLKLIFSNWKYIAISAAIAISFWIVFAILDGLLFFSPSLVFWIPSDAVTNFIISTIIAIMLGIVVSMNVYYVLKNCSERNFKINNGSNKKKKPTFFSYLSISPLLAILTTGCISCSSSLGLWILTSIATITGFGTATTLASFLSEYQIPINLLILALLGWSFVSINRQINKKNLYCTLINKRRIH